MCSPIPRSRAEPRVHCQLRATKYKPETGKIPRDWITLRAPTHTELATYGIEGYLSTSRAQPWLPEPFLGLVRSSRQGPKIRCSRSIRPCGQAVRTEINTFN